VLEGGVLTFYKHPEKSIHISNINKGVPDEGRNCLHVGVGGGVEGSEVVIFDFEIVLGSVRSSGRELPVA
jgi:hypothetical protein